MKHILLAMLIATLLTGCGSLPPLAGRTSSSALEDTRGSRLGRALSADVASHFVRSVISPLNWPEKFLGV